MKNIITIIVAITVLLTFATLCHAEEDISKLPPIVSAEANYQKAIDTSNELEAKLIEKAKKDNEDRQIAAKKRLILALRQVAVGNKHQAEIVAYANTLEKGDTPETKPSSDQDPIKLTVPMDQWAQGTFVADIKKGQTVKITASGKWYVDRDSITDPDGRKDRSGWSFPKEIPGGALCGIFKDGEKDPVKFVVGSKFVKKFNVDGKLYLTGNGGTILPSGSVEAIITISE